VAGGIIELHGGNIRVESSDTGSGSKFTIDLPISQDARKAVPRSIRRYMSFHTKFDSTSQQAPDNNDNRNNLVVIDALKRGKAGSLML